MIAKRIAVIGGGPAGLLAARLLARAGFAVTLFERLDPAATYGFGVALAGRGLHRLSEHDLEAADRIVALCHPLEKWTMCRGGESASVENHGGFGVERTALLRTLQSLAIEAGARIEAGTEADVERAAENSDVVVLADGVGSQGRDLLASRLGAVTDTVPMPYIWCGANVDLDGMTLAVKRTEHGIFCAHVMPYGDGRCTFQVDTVAGTLESARLGETEFVSDSASDSDSLRFLSELFSSLLDEGGLLGNRSRWSNFRLVTCERWSDGRVVLLGDAAHTAHYTVGSGTRMAMEDAIVLSQALIGESSMAAAFTSYERERRPAVEHLQWRAQRSQTWWRTLAERYDLPLPVLLFSYFTRTGSVGLDELARTNAGIAQAAIAHNRRVPEPIGAGSSAAPGADHEVLAGRVVSKRALYDHVVEVACDSLQPWSEATHALAGDLHRDTVRGILLTGSDDRPLLLDRFDIAEELRTVADTPVAVAVSKAAREDAATAVAAGRVDYVVFED